MFALGLIHLESAGIESRYALVSAQFETLLNAAVDAIILIDSSAKICIFNPSAQRLLGYSEAEVVGKNVSMIMPTQERKHHDGYIQAYLDGGQPKIIGIGRVVKAQKKNGDLVSVELTVGDVKSNQGHYFVGILRDVTVRLATEKEVQQQREALAYASRISVMGEMAAGIAHEMNQPLSAILNYSKAATNLLSNDLKSTEEKLTTASNILTKIAEQAYRGGQIIQGFRNFVKHKEVEKVGISLQDLLYGALELVALDSRWIDVVFEMQGRECLDEMVQVDIIQIQQVLVNLLRNALDAMQSVSEKKVALSVAIEDDCFVSIKVSDSGQGVDLSIRDQLFEPFKTTKDSGMGMGLAICSSIIRSHGGSMMVVESELGGAGFLFTMPRYIDETV